MVKLIIVDDEKITRDSLKEYIKWDDIGVDMVETAKNGFAALEISRVFEPDILLTDVRMPKMDGIELATAIRTLYPDCKIIFISGYSDKEYLKSAIHLKAVSYIEKPLDLEEVKSVVKNAVSACIEETKSKAANERLKNSLADSLPLIREEMALKITKENADPEKLRFKYDDPFLKHPADTCFYASYILLDPKRRFEAEPVDSIKRTVMDIFYSDAPGDTGLFLPGFVDARKIVLIIAKPCSIPECEENSFEGIFDRLKEMLGDDFSITIGVGEKVRGLKNIPKSCLSAQNAAKMQFYMGFGRIYHHGKYINMPFDMGKNLFSNFKELLRKGNKQATDELLEDLVKNARAAADNNIDKVKDIYFNLLLLIFEVAREREMLEQAVENEKGYIWQEIDDIKTLNELSDFIKSNINTIFNRSNEKNVFKRKTYEIIRYIRENYADKDLSINTIANRAFLSPTYLCSFFKKTTGKTLNEFITEVRIEKAKELLKDGRLKLYDVASRIGFVDTNYFSTLFKKFTGITPSEYREKH